MARLVRVESKGLQDVYDINVKDFHNYIANGVVVHNCMKIVQLVGKFTPAESNKFRKVIAKKKKDPDVLTMYENKFIEGGLELVKKGGITETKVRELWSQMVTFAGYGFNKSHAIEYSAVSSAQLWLRHHYFPEYICALLENTDKGKKKYDKIVLNYFIAYSRKKGVDVKRPDINESKEGFTLIDDNTVRFGLSKIKYVGSVAKGIVENQPYEDFDDFLTKMTGRKVNKRVVEALISSGAFDSFLSRDSALNHYHMKFRKSKDWEVKYRSNSEIEGNEQMVLDIVLGKASLLEQHKDKIEEFDLLTPSDLSNNKFRRMNIVGVVSDKIKRKTKKDKDMWIVTLKDELETVKFFVWDNHSALISKVRNKDVIAVTVEVFGDRNSLCLSHDSEIIIL